MPPYGNAPGNGRRVAIIAGVRTPFARSGTALKDYSAIELGRMAVAEAARGSGTGRALLDLLVATAADRGLPVVELHAQVHARGFYERAGFTPFGEVYLEAGIEHVGMRREL